MTKLSVNINKVATLRNARGGNIPNLIKFAIDCQNYGAQGITVHPRPDERHIKYQDVYDLKKVVNTEFNIEGFPNDKFINMVLEIKPHQVTLVPDPPDAVTSNAGWDTVKHSDFLKPIIEEFNNNGIRTSLFMENDNAAIEYAKKLDAKRIELYTESYAISYPKSASEAIKDYIDSAVLANNLGLGLNAGHDLNMDNLKYFTQNIPNLLEVSIGHALISDALYFGIENTIQLYRRCLV